MVAGSSHVLVPLQDAQCLEQAVDVDASSWRCCGEPRCVCSSSGKRRMHTPRYWCWTMKIVHLGTMVSLAQGHVQPPPSKRYLGRALPLLLWHTGERHDRIARGQSLVSLCLPLVSNTASRIRGEVAEEEISEVRSSPLEVHHFWVAPLRQDHSGAVLDHRVCTLHNPAAIRALHTHPPYPTPHPPHPTPHPPTRAATLHAPGTHINHKSSRLRGSLANTREESIPKIREGSCIAFLPVLRTSSASLWSRKQLPK